MLHALASALATFPNKKAWRRLQKNGMKADYSWDRSAAEYVKMYRRLTRRNASNPAASKR
jgi:starch synthase